MLILLTACRSVDVPQIAEEDYKKTETYNEEETTTQPPQSVAVDDEIRTQVQFDFNRYPCYFVFCHDYDHPNYEGCFYSTHIPELDRIRTGTGEVVHYGFYVNIVGWPTRVTNGNTNFYAFIGSDGLAMHFEEDGFSLVDDRNLYANIPDEKFPIPMEDGEIISYDYFHPPSIWWLGVTYSYLDLDVAYIYMEQLRDSGFEVTELGEIWLEGYIVYLGSYTGETNEGTRYIWVRMVVPLHIYGNYFFMEMASISIDDVEFFKEEFMF